MSVAFNTIAANILVPGSYIEFDPRQAVQGLPAMPHRILIIAPRLATGSLAALTPKIVRSANEGEAFCGRGSIGAAMIAAAKTANPYTDIEVIGVTDAVAGVAATGTLAVTGPATTAGTLNLYIAGVRVQVAITSGNTATQIGDAIVAAIAANTALPVTAANVTGTVTLTARNKGTTGNDIDLRLNYNYGDETPAGVAIAITAMASGATNPDLATVVAAVGDTHYHTIITPWTDAANLVVLENWMTDRWGGMIMKEGHVFAAHYGTYSAASTLVDGRNSPHLSVVPTQKSPTPQYCVAAMAGVIDASQAESPSNCNRPRQTMPLTGMLPPAPTDRYTWTERNALLADGGCTFVVDDGGVCRIERLVTTYKTSNGVPDASYQDIEIMRALAYLRYSTRARIALRFPRFKLANNGTPIPPGEQIVTPNGVREELIALFQDWQAVGLVEGLEQFKAELLVERNSSDANRVDAIIPPDVINGFRVFAAQIQPRL